MIGAKNAIAITNDNATGPLSNSIILVLPKYQHMQTNESTLIGLHHVQINVYV
jgi:hypothetical protein